MFSTFTSNCNFYSSTVLKTVEYLKFYYIKLKMQKKTNDIIFKKEKPLLLKSSIDFAHRPRTNLKRYTFQPDNTLAVLFCLI